MFKNYYLKLKFFVIVIHIFPYYFKSEYSLKLNKLYNLNIKLNCNLHTNNTNEYNIYKNVLFSTR